MNLHGAIMNLPAKPREPLLNVEQAYKVGHRDARHAAAELALKTDAAMEDAARVIRELCATYNHPMPDATLARLAGLE